MTSASMIPDDRSGRGQGARVLGRLGRGRAAAAICAEFPQLLGPTDGAARNASLDDVDVETTRQRHEMMMAAGDDGRDCDFVFDVANRLILRGVVLSAIVLYYQAP